MAAGVVFPETLVLADLLRPLAVPTDDMSVVYRIRKVVVDWIRSLGRIQQSLCSLVTSSYVCIERFLSTLVWFFAHTASVRHTYDFFFDKTAEGCHFLESATSSVSFEETAQELRAFIQR